MSDNDSAVENEFPPDSIIKYPRTDGHHTSGDVKESATSFFNKNPFERIENNDVPDFLQFAMEAPNLNCLGSEPRNTKFLELKSQVKNEAPFKEGWAKFGNDQKHAEYLLSCFLDTPQPVTLAPGTKIYRIVGALNNKYETNDYCGEWWTLEPLPSREEEWRSGYAVWDHWNGDGGYIEYTVGKDGLNVWQGITGPQALHEYKTVLMGGRVQIWVPQHTINPLESGLSKKDITKRTPWNPGKDN